jgi:hypothetical protein
VGQAKFIFRSSFLIFEIAEVNCLCNQDICEDGAKLGVTKMENEAKRSKRRQGKAAQADPESARARVSPPKTSKRKRPILAP